MKETSISNIETFNRSVGLLFGKLYETFPKRVQLGFNDLAIEMFDDDDNGNEVYFEKLAIFSETVSWLEQAGYIWADKIDNYDAYGIVLSPKGLEVMKVVPGTLSGKSIGEELSKIVKSGAKETAKTVVSGLVSFALTEGFKLLSK